MRAHVYPYVQRVYACTNNDIFKVAALINSTKYHHLSQMSSDGNLACFLLSLATINGCLQTSILTIRLRPDIKEIKRSTSWQKPQRRKGDKARTIDRNKQRNGDIASGGESWPKTGSCDWSRGHEGTIVRYCSSARVARIREKRAETLILRDFCHLHYGPRSLCLSSYWSHFLPRYNQSSRTHVEFEPGTYV